jgi:transcription antitermination factor NusG
MRELCRWYALTVKHQHEQTVRAALEHKGFKALAPVYRARRRWSDREKEIERPWFAGYVFCRFALEDKIGVLNTPAVSRIVGFGGECAPIPDSEMDAIQQVIAAKVAVRPWPFPKPGDRVRIERGPLRGVEGSVLAEAGETELVISVELLQRSIAVRLDPEVLITVAKGLAVAG